MNALKSVSLNSPFTPSTKTRFSGHVHTDVSVVDAADDKLNRMRAQLHQLVLDGVGPLSRVTTGNNQVRFTLRPHNVTDDTLVMDGRSIITPSVLRTKNPLAVLDVTVTDEDAVKTFPGMSATAPNVSVRDTKGTSSTASILLFDQPGSLRLVGSESEKKHHLLTGLSRQHLVGIVDQLVGRNSVMKLNDGPRDLKTRFELDA